MIKLEIIIHEKHLEDGTVEFLIKGTQNSENVTECEEDVKTLIMRKLDDLNRMMQEAKRSVQRRERFFGFLKFIIGKK